MKECAKCGSKKVDHGAMQINRSPGMYVAFESGKKRLFGGETIIHAYVCLSCGYTELYTSPENIKKTMKKKK
jgi:predicted nucleic-acid-binding Zn-ribbon protein